MKHHCLGQGHDTVTSGRVRTRAIGFLSRTKHYTTLIVNSKAGEHTHRHYSTHNFGMVLLTIIITDRGVSLSFLEASPCLLNKNWASFHLGIPLTDQKPTYNSLNQNGALGKKFIPLIFQLNVLHVLSIRDFSFIVMCWNEREPPLTQKIPLLIKLNHFLNAGHSHGILSQFIACLKTGRSIGVFYLRIHMKLLVFFSYVIFTLFCSFN